MGNLTQDFDLYELRQRAGRGEPELAVPAEFHANIRQLAEQLQILRDAIGEPLHTVSGWRSPALNAKLPGAAKHSYHLLGMAADVRPATMPVEEFFEIACELTGLGDLDLGGIGLYAEPHNRFVHCDIGAKWRRRIAGVWQRIAASGRPS